MTRIIVCGCFGRMGSAVCRLAAINPKIETVAGVDIMSPGGGLAFPIYTDITQCETPADAIISFCPPSAVADTLTILDYCIKKQIPLVQCTTGLPAEVMITTKRSAEKVAVFQSANMSLGINLLANILSRTAKLLYDTGFDTEIVEKHHNKKLDAPSGTAYILADAINDSLGQKMTYTNDRSQNRSERKREEIGIHAIRGGTIVGEHNIIFAGKDEVIELTHIAQSRDVFAVGALKAAQFIKDKPPGYYGMQDLINSVPMDEIQ